MAIYSLSLNTTVATTGAVTAAVAWALASAASLSVLASSPSLYTYVVVRCAAELLTASAVLGSTIGGAVASGDRLDQIDAEE